MSQERTLVGRKPLGCEEARNWVADAVGGAMEMALLGTALDVGFGRSWT